MSWTIRFYESPGGQQPVHKFIRSLQPQTKAKLVGLLELRVRCKEEVRSLYCFQYKDVIVILHAFKKKTMAITKRDLEVAVARKHELERLD